MIADAAGERARVSHGPSRVQGNLVADTARLRDELGVRPAVGLAEGLRSLVAAAVQPA
jgi:nucleoside-diphosphate-sugar epimerase